MSADDWERPTAAAPWTVRDVVAHLLGDDVARLGRTRDGQAPGARAPGETFAGFVHRRNGEWVAAAGRISPALLIDLLEVTTPQVLALWRAADLGATGEPVSWAGPEPAPVWPDCARDFTEYWVHQQQIRDATGRPGQDGAAVVHAVLDTFLRAMPSTLDGSSRPAGSALTVVVSGPAGGRWSWRSEAGHWWPAEQDHGSATTVGVDADLLWRLCVRMVEPEDARQRVSVTGDGGLAAAALRIVSIIC